MGDAPRARRSPQLDDADRQLIALLTADGRLSNRTLAAQVGLTEPTVAARLRSLSERHILGVTASIDWVAAGFTWDAWLQIWVEGRAPREVSADIAKVKGVHLVSTVIAPFDLFAHLLLRDASEAVDVISEQINRIPGVRAVRPNVSLETMKFATKHARVPIPLIPLDFPSPVVDLDPLDRALIDALIVDGRQSNRAAARTLGVSEGTIRLRLRRMEEAGLLRITARSDPLLTGELTTFGVLGVDVERGETRKVGAALAELDEVGMVSLVAGSHDVLASIQTASHERMLQLVLNDIRDLPGVRAVQSWEVVHNRAFHYQWARLVPDA
jgi:DNA-binding Lrp family transcriptional regulator